MSAQGHIAITVSGTTTELVIDPNSYQEVDVVDFAPRAVAGSPAFSELGLYLDVAQDSFGGGFGKWRFSEPRSYAYSGSFVDTRHNTLSLFTDFDADTTTTLEFTTNTPDETYYYTPMLHDYHTPDGDAIPVLSMAREKFDKSNGEGHALLMMNSSWPQSYTSTGSPLVITEDLSGFTTSPDTIWYAKFWPVGKYMFITQPEDGQLKLAVVAEVQSHSDTVVTFNAGVAFESTDLWAGGYAYTAVATGTAITGSTANTVTASGGGFGASNQLVGKNILLIVDVGVASNPPEGFDFLAVFGGYFWANEHNTNYLHYWSEIDGSDAEGGGESDLAVIKVGPPGQPITNMIVFNNQLWVFRPDGAWVIGEDKIAYHTLDFQQEVHINNFRAVTTWNGFMYFTVRNRIYKFRSGLQDITPPPITEAPPQNMFGGFQGLVPRGKFLYVTATSQEAFSDETAEASSNYTSLLAYDGVGWHKLFTYTDDALGQFSHGVGISTYDDQLYVWAYTTNGNNYDNEVRRVQLQEFSDLPYQDFPTSGNHNLYTSYFDLGMKRIPKSWASVSLEGYFPTDTSVDVYFRVDANTSWTSLGTFTSNLQEIDFPSGTEGKKIQLKLDLQTDDSTATPVIQSLILKVMMRPDVLYGVSCNVIIESNLSTPTREPLNATANEIRAALKAARSSVSPITLRDIHGNSASAYLSSVQFFTINDDQNTAEYEETARCTFVYV